MTLRLQVKAATITYPENFFFKQKTVIKNLSFSAHTGDLIGIVGSNGTGKSTLLKAICGLITLKSGSITYNKSSVGYMPENCSGPPFLTCLSLMKYAGALSHIHTDALTKKINDLFDIFDLHAYKYKKIETLSKGTKQKLFFAQSIIHDPDLLILDEPFSGLDDNSKTILISFIKNLAKKNTTIVCSTHTQNTKLFNRFITL